MAVLSSVIWPNKRVKKLMRMVELIEDRLLLKMELFIQDNGILGYEMDLVAKCGQMAVDTKATGNLTKLTAKANSFMPMAISTKGSGSTTKLMERVLTLTPTVLTIMVIGSTINSMDSAWSPGLMVLSTRVTTSTVRRKAKEN